MYCNRGYQIYCLCSCENNHSKQTIRPKKNIQIQITTKSNYMLFTYSEIHLLHFIIWCFCLNRYSNWINRIIVYCLFYISLNCSMARERKKKRNKPSKQRKTFRKKFRKKEWIIFLRISFTETLWYHFTTCFFLFKSIKDKMEILF